MWKCYCQFGYLIIIALLITERSLVFSMVSDDIQADVDCHPVKHVFVSNYGMEDLSLPRHVVQGLQQRICMQSLSCCTPAMETHLLERSRKDFQIVLKKQSQPMREALSKNAQDLQKSTLLLINISQENMKRKMNEFRPGIQTMLLAEIHDLYSDIRNFLQGRNLDLNLSDSFRNYLDAVFAVLYHRVVRRQSKAMNPRYKTCLKEARQDLHSYSSVLTDLASNVSRSLEITRAIVQALDLGVEVIDTTDHYRYHLVCYNAFVRMRYCQTCRGVQGYLPCSGFCKNVFRGCLTILHDLASPWREYMKAIESLVRELHYNLYIEPLLTNYPNSLLEEMERIIEVTSRDDKLSQACGHLLLPEDFISGTPEAPVIISNELRDLKSKLQSLISVLDDSHNHYTYLPDILCSNNDTASHHNKECWNGHDAGEYDKQVANIHSGQRYNPEIRMEGSNATRSSQISQLSEKLRHVRHLLISKIPPFRDTTSYFMDQGSGSGQYYNQAMDTDADSEGTYEGSGSGYGPYEGEATDDASGGQPGGTNIFIDKDKTSGCGSLSISLFLVFVLFSFSV